MRVAIIAAAVLSIVGLARATDALAMVRKETHIQAEALSGALRELAKERGFQVLFRSDIVRDVRTSGAVGYLTTDEALKQLLEGSPLTFRYLDEKTVSIVPIHAEQTLATPVKPEEGKPDSPTTFHLAQTAQGAPAQAVAVGQTVAAKEPSAALTEIVVTAQKRNERIQDVPIPVTAINAQALADRNQLLIRDYSSTVPGLSVSPSPGSGGQQQLAIRGISTGYNTNPTVGVTVDDVPFGSSINIFGNVVPDVDPSNLQRIEILRGPQGTLYGASSMGGLIKFVTVDPSMDAVSGRVQADVNTVRNGAEAGYGFRGAVNVPLGDTLAIRVSGFTRQDPGYIDNPILHIDGVNEDRASGGLFTGLWRPTNVFSLKVNALIQEIKGDGSYEADVPSPGSGLPALGPLQQDYLPGIGAYDRKIQFYSATLNAKLGGVDLTAVTGYDISRYTNSIDFTYALGGYFQQAFGAGGAGIFNDADTKKFSQEIRASIPIGERVDWLIGGFYTHEDSLLTQDVAAMNPTSGAVVVDTEHVPQPWTSREYAAFTDFTFHFTDQFNVQIGGRDSHIEVTNLQSTYTGPLVGGTSVNPEVASSANAFTYLVTPQFKVSPDLMVYARIASGYRAGGPNGAVSPNSPLYDPAEPHQFNPDKTQNYELGVKGDVVSHVLSFDASVYHIDWKNIQINLQDPINSGTYTTNGGRAKSQGVELSLESKPLVGLTIAAWAAYDQAVLTQDFPTGGPTSASGVSGDRLPYSSRFSGSVSATEEFPITGSVSGFVGGTVSYVGDRLGTFNTIAAPKRTTYPAYTRTDLHAGVKYDSWTVNLFVNNVADERGVLGGGLGTYPPFAFTYVQPRTAGLSITRTF